MTITMSKSNPSSSTNSQQKKQASSRDKKGKDNKKKYSFIPDNFSTLDQVTAALREAGLESSNLIVGIDFTKSNEWTGKVSFNNRSLHAIGDTPNPYEKAISIIGKTLAPSDDDNLIPCFGFATTHDQVVFSFHSDHFPCHGFEEVLACYRNKVPNLRLAGPTSYVPVIEAAMDIVEKSGEQYHVLIIVADGQVLDNLAPRNRKQSRLLLMQAHMRSQLCLWELEMDLRKTCRNLMTRLLHASLTISSLLTLLQLCQNTKLHRRKKQLLLLLRSWKSPFNIKQPLNLAYLAYISLTTTCITGRPKEIIQRPPPVPYTRRPLVEHEPSSLSSPSSDERSQT